MSTPQVPSGMHSPAPDASPPGESSQASDDRASALARARRMVPEGTFAVGAGLAISGITTYGFQILAFRGLSKPDYAALNALWVFVFVLAPGVFLPLEQEVGRALSARRVRGVGGGPVVRRAGLLGGAFSVVLALGIIVVSTTTGFVQHKFNGHVGLVVCLVVALFTFGVEYLARGAFAGVGRFGAYGLSLGAEGVIRLLPCVPLAIANVTNPVWYGLCLAVPPLLATRCAMYGQSGLMLPGPGGAVVGALEQSRLPARRIAARAGAELRAVPGRPGAGEAEAARPRCRLHRRALLVAAPDPVVPSGASGVAPEALDARERGP